MKSELLQIRLSEIDKNMIKSAADKRQMSMSEYLVYLVRKDNDK